MPEHPIPPILKPYFAGLDGCGCKRPQTMPMIPPIPKGADALSTYPQYAWCPRCGYIGECIAPDKPLRWFKPTHATPEEESSP